MKAAEYAAHCCFDSTQEGVPNQMRSRIIRTCSTTLSLLLLIAVPTQASPLKFVDVINVMGDLQNGGQTQRLKLRAALQDPTTQAVAQNPSTSVAATPAIDPQLPGSAVAKGTDSVAPSLVAGTEVTPQRPQGDVQVFEQDSVDGSICDCGEIPPVGGISPQSQMLPSTLSCSKTCTSPWGRCGVTSVPATSEGATLSVPLATADPGSCGSIAGVAATLVDGFCATA